MEAAEDPVGQRPHRGAFEELRDAGPVGGAEQRGRGPRVESQSGTDVGQLEGVLVGEGEPVHGPAPERGGEVGRPGALFLSEAVDGPGDGGGAVALPRAEQHPDPDRLAGGEGADVAGQQVGDAGGDADAEHGGRRSAAGHLRPAILPAALLPAALFPATGLLQVGDH
ncbi:hypothetical protein Q0Z83_014950 [Actinoplanes sichuanensis]|nr:hypothetical protein Q0Z83_014950 [Actinoplanes sichuanensis]